MTVPLRSTDHAIHWWLCSWAHKFWKHRVSWQVWFIPSADVCWACIKLWDPLRTCAIPERLKGVITTRRYTNPFLAYLTLPSASVTWPDAKILAAQYAYKLHACAPKLWNALLQIWQWFLDTENSSQMVLKCLIQFLQIKSTILQVLLDTVCVYHLTSLRERDEHLAYAQEDCKLSVCKSHILTISPPRHAS